MLELLSGVLRQSAADRETGKVTLDMELSSLKSIGQSKKCDFQIDYRLIGPSTPPFLMR